MEPRRNKVTMDLDEYRKLIEEIAQFKHQYTALLKEHCKVLQARYEILPKFIDNYSMKHFTLQEVTKLNDDVRCGLEDVDKLIGLFEPNELIAYIANEKERMDGKEE